MQILTRLSHNFSQKAAIPLSLGYPFEYTLNPQQFSFMDVRFTEVPYSRDLFKPEKEHVQFVLQQFQELLNGSKSMLQLEHISKSLKDKNVELRQIAKESNFQLSFSIQSSSIIKSCGYYEIKPQENTVLDLNSIEEIHNYQFARQKQALKVWQKQKKSQLSPEEQLKKDIKDKIGDPGKDIKDRFEEMKMSKQATYYNRLVQGLLSIGKKAPTSKKFQPYYIVDQIKGTLACEMSFEGQKYSDKQVQFDSKWLYKVENLQSIDLKKYRKRTLFDFQYWSRGSIFPAHNFVADIPQSQ